MNKNTNTYSCAQYSRLKEEIPAAMKAAGISKETGSVLVRHMEPSQC